MFRFNNHPQGAATSPDSPRRRILTDYFNNYNFSEDQQYAP